MQEEGGWYHVCTCQPTIELATGSVKNMDDNCTCGTVLKTHRLAYLCRQCLLA